MARLKIAISLCSVLRRLPRLFTNSAAAHCLAPHRLVAPHQLRMKRVDEPIARVTIAVILLYDPAYHPIIEMAYADMSSLHGSGLSADRG